MSEKPITHGSHPADLRLDHATKKWWIREKGQTVWVPLDGNREGRPMDYDPCWGGWVNLYTPEGMAEYERIFDTKP